MIKTYTVTKTELNCWNEDRETGKRTAIIIDTCGHRHRSYAAAIRCQTRLLDYNRHLGSVTWSAYWHNSTIRYSDGSLAEDDTL